MNIPIENNMKKIYFLLIGLFGLLVQTQGQEFIIKYASPEGQIPANLNSFLNNDDNYVSRDLNGDGIPDMPVFQVINDSVAVKVLNGFSNTVLWQRNQLAHRDDQEQRPRIEGFTDFGDETTSTILTGGYYNDSLWCRLPQSSKLDGLEDSSSDNMSPAVIILDVNTKMATFGYRRSRLLAVTDIDNDNYPDLVLADMLLTRIVVAGVDTDGFVSEEEEQIENNLLSFRDDYELSLKYESEANGYLALQNLKFNNLGDLDLEGDGNIELVSLLTSSGEPEGIEIVDGQSQETEWAFMFPQEHLDNIRDGGFHGFFDLDGDGEKEVVMGNNIVITLDKTVYPIGDAFEIQAILDIDLDGFPDLLGRDSVNNTIQVWGKAMSTPTFSYEAALMQLGQNFPNPFLKTTSISYTLDEAGEVALVVYDANGRMVDTLVREKQVPGIYAVEWNAEDLPGGQYYYQLTVNDKQQARKMILLR